MKKKYNYLLALAVFLVIMICFNKFGYIISYLAAIGGPLVMGNNGTMVVYEFLMSHLNLVSAILYLMVLPIPALWYYLAFQLREGGIRAIPGKCRRVGLDGCVLIALFTFGMIHVTSIILAIVARSLPDAMDNYQNLIENSGLTEYSLMWVFSTLILPPLVEEMIFRGLIQKYLERAGMHWIWRMLYRRFCLECSIKISYREFMRHFWGLHLDLWRIAITPGGIHADAYVL